MSRRRVATAREEKDTAAASPSRAQSNRIRRHTTTVGSHATHSRLIRRGRASASARAERRHMEGRRAHVQPEICEEVARQLDAGDRLQQATDPSDCVV